MTRYISGAIGDRRVTTDIPTALPTDNLNVFEASHQRVSTSTNLELEEAERSAPRARDRM